MKWILPLLLLNINTQAQHLIPYLEDSKYGYSSIEGEVLIDPKYDEVDFFNDKIAFVRRDSIWLIINKKGDELPFFESIVKPKLSSVKNKTDLKYSFRQKYDTLHNLKSFKPTKHTVQFINLDGFRATEIYQLEKPNIRSGIYVEKSASFQLGYFIAKSQSGQYLVLDKNASVIARSSTKPKIWDSHFISYAEDGSTILIDVVNGKTKKVPYRNVVDVIRDKYLIVTNREAARMKYYFRESPSKIGVLDWDSQVIIDITYDNIRWSGEKHFLVQNENHFFIDRENNKVSNEYLTVFRLSPDYYNAKNHDKQMVILDNHGQEMGLGGFDKIKYNSNEDYYTWYRDDSCGILDHNLNEVISYAGQAIYPTPDKTHFAIQIDNKEGLIDIYKNIIIEPIYERCHLYEDGFVRIKNNEKEGLASIDGKILFQPIYEKIEVVKSNNETYLRPKKDGLYACYTVDLVQLSGFTSRTPYISSDVISRFKEDDMFHLTNRFGEPLGIVTKEYNKGFVESDSTFLLQIVNEDSLFLLVLEENRFITAYNEDKLQILKGNMKRGIFSFIHNDMEGVINHKNEVILQPKKREITELGNNYILSKEDNKYFMYDLEGSLLNENGFDFMSSWYNNLRAVGNFDKDETYKFIKSACIYGKADTVSKDAMKIGYINKLGEVIVPLEYNFKTRYFEKYTALTKGLEDGNKTTCLVDTSGNIILKTNYDKLYPLDHTDESGLYIASLKDKKGLIDLDGHIVLPAEYTAISKFNESDFFKVRDTNSIWHLCNNENKILLSNIGQNPIRVDYFSYENLQRNRYLVSSKEDAVIIDEHGNELKRITEKVIQIINTNNIQLLEVSTPNGNYFLNTDNLIEYRKSND